MYSYVYVCLPDFFLTQSKEVFRMNKQEIKQGPEARHSGGMLPYQEVCYLRINGGTMVVK